MLQLLRRASLICCAFVIASFLLFAVAQTSRASQGQASAISAGTGTGTGTAARPEPISSESQPRRLIDQVAEALNSPWAGIVATHNRWMQRLAPTLCSLLVYGLLIGFLARWAASRPSTYV